MPENKTAMGVSEAEEHEKEARICALRQLLNATQARVIGAFEGGLSLDEYNALREQRKSWTEELAELTGEPAPSGANLAPDVLTATVESRNIASIMFVLEAEAENSRLDAATLTEHADMFPIWDENWTGRRGTIVRDEGKLYRSLHDVGAGQNTKPSETPAMWKEIGDPTVEWPEWSQPIGAIDAYPLGAKVSHNGSHWTSEVDNNVWEPGVYGWKKSE